MLFLTLVCVDACRAEASNEGIVLGGRYCGIISLQSCLGAIGKPITLDQLWKPKYVGTSRGSTVGELIVAAQDMGVYAEGYTGLTHFELAHSQHPMLLHIRSSDDGVVDFNHWAAFLGCRGKDVILADPQVGERILSVGELMGLWDGLAIAVSPQPIGSEAKWIAMGYFLIPSLLITAIVAAWKIVQGDASRCVATRLRPSVFAVALIVVLSMSLGLIIHTCSSAGFMRNRDVVADIAARYRSTWGEDVGIEELRAIMSGDEDVTMIDARAERDFRNGSIGGAMNIPAHSPLEKRKELLKNVPSHGRIIVFCQSRACPWGDSVASFLRYNGYERVSVFRGGYREWTEGKL